MHTFYSQHDGTAHQFRDKLETNSLSQINGSKSWEDKSNVIGDKLREAPPAKKPKSLRICIRRMLTGNL